MSRSQINALVARSYFDSGCEWEDIGEQTGVVFLVAGFSSCATLHDDHMSSLPGANMQHHKT